MMNTYYIVIETLSGEYTKDTSLLVTAENEEAAKRAALIGECHSDEDNLEWSGRGVYDLGGEFHYAIYSCALVPECDIPTLEKYLWRTYA
jgi:hypothetical protein